MIRNSTQLKYFYNTSFLRGDKKEKERPIYLVFLEGKDRVQVSELFMDHQTEDAHHGGTAVVQLDGTLLQLSLLVELVPAIVDGTGPEVPGELPGSGVVPHDELQRQDEGEDLSPSADGDLGDGSGTGRDGRERRAGVINVPRQPDTGVVRQEPDDGQHGDPSVPLFLSK
mmetsp:Transcript_29590/g.71529  ORF Transcript_29590/g.71529 Transcript_29590/m.71529 type:complete len:170 (+) Transcript_29590:68-577(+)